MSKETRKLPDSHWVSDASEKSRDFRFYMVGHIAAEVGEIFNALQKGNEEQALDEIEDAISGLEILKRVMTWKD